MVGNSSGHVRPMLICWRIVLERSEGALLYIQTESEAMLAGKRSEENVMQTWAHYSYEDLDQFGSAGAAAGGDEAQTGHTTTGGRDTSDYGSGLAEPGSRGLPSRRSASDATFVHVDGQPFPEDFNVNLSTGSSLSASRHSSTTPAEQYQPYSHGESMFNEYVALPNVHGYLRQEYDGFPAASSAALADASQFPAGPGGTTQFESTGFSEEWGGDVGEGSGISGSTPGLTNQVTWSDPPASSSSRGKRKKVNQPAGAPTSQNVHASSSRSSGTGGSRQEKEGKSQRQHHPHHHQRHQQPNLPPSPLQQQQPLQDQQQNAPSSSSIPPPPRRKAMRTASRTSKNALPPRPTETPEERKSRASHNQVEKQYRNRLNAQFDTLLQALPDTVRSPLFPPGSAASVVDGEGDGDDNEAGAAGSSSGAWTGQRRVSKAEVLDMAVVHIKNLESERDALELERDQLTENIRVLRERLGDDALPDGVPPGQPSD
ncbi:hypothetical protein VTK73DRAFT_5402 [Phialemonium thermophilum]|uniref:BHLH domain-containing protein n=1 Tax=Phialemonium thermophilum TaxID=223376 RepID=A0ABR3WPI0_9PEZI